MAETNPNVRLEAFCDGVFAIALTLLIIDIKIPSTESIHNTSEFWLALGHTVPSIFAFVLSFTIILITWVNHHAALKLVHKSSAPFIYSNGFLLLSVVIIPFPTTLLGAFLFSDHASPAVILYNAVLAVQSIGWILLTGTALRGRLIKGEESILTMGKSWKYGYIAFTIYSLCAIIAFWFPLSIAVVTTLIWIFWLTLGITMKHE